jgi:hypothetical protein
VKHLCCADSQLSKRSNRSIRVGKTLLNQRVFTMCVWIIDSGQGHATRPAVAGRRTVGILLNQIWSVSGANDRDDVNSTYLQPFLNYNLGGGLSAGQRGGERELETDEAWTAPLLFSVSKVTLLGKRPVSFSVAAGPTIASPDGGPDWRFRLAATFLFPR